MTSFPRNLSSFDGNLHLTKLLHKRFNIGNTLFINLIFCDHNPELVPVNNASV
jgi:hypothetical protein